MKQEYKQISEEWLQLMAGHDIWSIECMAGHEAEGREVKYIGSRIEGHLDNDRRDGWRVRDYYIDESGEYWHQTRAALPSGEIVSMEMRLFGYEGTRRTNCFKGRTNYC